MSRVCQVCGKSAMAGKKVSFSNKKSNKKWGVNIQETTLEVNGVKKKVKACTKCIKSSKK